MTNINEDCPHRQQLEHTLLHCQTQSEILQATRDNYLSIIEEFQRDLEELTEQVEQQQQQQQQQQQREQLEHELTTEHDQTELQHYKDLPGSNTSELELQNERLVCQVHNLQGALADREHQIQELRTMINGYADISETNKLKDEISALKLKNSEQSQKVCEIANLLKAQQDERQKLCKNYEKLLDSSEEKYKELRRANRELQSLRDRLAQLEKQQCELTTERDLLREEVIALKEKEAESSGRERALNDQLRCRQQEMDKSRCLLRDMQQHLKHEERQHKETVDRLCRANEEIRLQMHAVAGECKQMHLKLKQQADVNGQQYLIIESFRKWKDAQIRSDDAMRQCVNKAEEHINALLKENHRLCEEYRRLFGDYCLLEEENQTVRNAVNSRQTGGAYSPAKVHRGKEVHDDMTSRLRFLSSTSQRISAQVKALNARHRGIHSRLPDSDEQLTSPQSSSSATKLIYS